MPSSFDHVPRTPRGHLLLYFYAAVDHLLHDIERLGRVGGEAFADMPARYPFLAGYDEEIRRHADRAVPREGFSRWWEDQIGAWMEGAEGHFPLRALAADASLGHSRIVAWVVAGLVDEDSRFGTVFARMQEPLPYRRPCLETIGRMIGGGEPWDLFRPLLAAGLLEVPNRDAPRSEWVPRVPGLLWDAARSEPTAEPAPGCRYHPASEAQRVVDLIFPDEFLRQVEQVPVLLRTGRARVVVIRGTPGSERLEVAAAIAAADGRGVIEWREPGTRDHGEAATRPPDLLGSLCTLAGCLPVTTFELGPGETVELPTPSGYRGPTAVLLGLEGGLRDSHAENTLTLTLPSLGLDHRLRHWERVLEGRPVTDLEAIAERYQLPGVYIRQAGRLAVAHAALHQREAVAPDDVRAACRTLNRQFLDSLATRLDADGSWNDLIVDEPTLEKLHELHRRCRHRERLLDRLGPGFGSSRNRGVRALFTGTSGTGKTLAARILAAELNTDIYRVDLSAVVNKYIGETEKNLQRVLSRAEELDVILLLDEGDALLGNRTDVKSSNDRYANLETDYLLQRLESYQGVIVVTTNAAQYIDTAFQRRMDVVVNFVPPGPEERLAIWLLHLPRDSAVYPGFLNTVKSRCTLTGGQIRNAALHATLMALEDGSRRVREPHIEEALRSEYRKAGGLYPLGNGSSGRPPQRSGEGDGRMESFLDALTGGGF